MNNQKNIQYFAVLCSSIVAFVNMTKRVESDLYVYFESFERARDVGLVEYWLTSGKWGLPFTDLGYVFFSWISSNILCGNTGLFIFVFSFISYMFFCKGIINWGKYLNTGALPIATAIIIACFYPYIFTRSAHVLRQFFSMCVLFYTVSRLPYSKNILEFIKNNWLYILLMVSFHKSSLFFVIIMCIPYLRYSFRTKRLAYLSVMAGLIGYQIIARFVLPALSADSSLAESVERASHDSYFELEGLSIIEYLTLIISIIISIRYPFAKNIREGYRHAMNLVFLLSIFIVFNSYQTDIARRFFYYLLPFLPLLWIVSCTKKRVSHGMNFGFSIFVFAFFSVYVQYGPWFYNLPLGFLFTPIPFYEFNWDWIKTAFYI